MDSKNTRDDKHDKHDKHDQDDMEFFLKANIPTPQIISILKSQNKSTSAIETFVTNYEASRKKIHKMIKKFIEKIKEKYGNELLDVPNLYKKGVKYTSSHNFTDAEKQAFQSKVLKGDFNEVYMPFEDQKLTEMYKFLGYSNASAPVMNIKAPDQATLNEIVRLYESTRLLHHNVKIQQYTYENCSPQATSGVYDSERHDFTKHIHPLLFALFVPKIETLEKRMLLTNFGRIVVNRAAPYVKKNSNFTDYQTMDEWKADQELISDVAKDPNSLQYFSNDTPISNLHKRFKIQIDLWKNVFNLRQGKYYSSNESDANDNITSFMNTINSYEWAFFDSPDMFQIQDEGSLLRKLLSVFSLRPIQTQLDSYNAQASYDNASGKIIYNNFANVTDTIYVQTPIINFRLNIKKDLTSASSGSLLLEDAFGQPDYYIIKRHIVAKKKTIIDVKDILIFNVNRKKSNQSIMSMDRNITMNYVDVAPIGLSSFTSVDTTEIDVTLTIDINRGGGTTPKNFNLKSLVYLDTYKIPDKDDEVSSFGCCAGVLDGPDIITYSPNTHFKSGGSEDVTAQVAFNVKQDEINKFGTIYVYVKDE